MQRQVKLAFSPEVVSLLNTSHFHKPQMFQLNMYLLLSLCPCLKYTPCPLYVCLRAPPLHYSTVAMLIHLFSLLLYNYKLLLSQIHSLSPLCHIFILLYCIFFSFSAAFFTIIPSSPSFPSFLFNQIYTLGTNEIIKKGTFSPSSRLFHLLLISSFTGSPLQSPVQQNIPNPAHSRVSSARKVHIYIPKSRL